MTDEELFRALDGLYAYDDGCTDSGIHDYELKVRCINYLADKRRELSTAGYTAWLAKFVRDMWISDEAIELGYGLEDMQGFIDWLDDDLSHNMSLLVS